VWGIDFPNPVGLAAGFDKNAECMTGIATLGLGFTEIGSVTPLPQPGNPKPRVFRLPGDGAIINSYGFNSEGLETVSTNLAKFRQSQANVAPAQRGVIGVNLGKNKDSSEEAEDFVQGVRALTKYADYLVINVSSPNTQGLRALQAKDKLRSLITLAKQELKKVVTTEGYCSLSCSPSASYCPPLLIKISPDMTDAEMADVASVAEATHVDGIIISNTTIGEREQLKDASLASLPGGLSGKPLLSRSNAALATMYKLTKGRIPIIGVGGVSSAEDAYEKVRLGASLVQVYTALVYEGPGLPANIKKGLVELLAADGHADIQAAVGSAHRPKK
jgi:dihydroorotate dehydrogenase